MKIGVDIDNVITDFDDYLLKEMIKEDKNKRNAGIINKNARRILDGMFDWTQEEWKAFLADNMENMAKQMSARRNCKKVLDRLLGEGDEIYLISHRAYPDYKSPRETTENWLKKHKINYTKLILSEKPDKTKECKENNIDIMIDDRIGQCEKMTEQGVKCFVMRTRYNYKDKHNLKVVSSWNNLYEEICKCKKEM